MTSEKYLKEVTVGHCGFSLEGILRCNAVKNGTVRDMRMYAALSSV